MTLTENTSVITNDTQGPQKYSHHHKFFQTFAVQKEQLLLEFTGFIGNPFQFLEDFGKLMSE